jgi:hypothetical protein
MYSKTLIQKAKFNKITIRAEISLDLTVCFKMILAVTIRMIPVLEFKVIPVVEFKMMPGVTIKPLEIYNRFNSKIVLKTIDKNYLNPEAQENKKDNPFPKF